ncbi:MAG: hypothetical protein D6798_13210 [Deltaproteobacteria bacterium]|nr:MAG: hypothetical protein D6798_13210 [Deltaproteobacteria bacterium]
MLQRCRDLGLLPPDGGQTSDDLLIELMRAADVGDPVDQVLERLGLSATDSRPTEQGPTPPDPLAQAAASTAVNAAFGQPEPQVDLVDGGDPVAFMGINKGPYQAESDHRTVPGCTKDDPVACQYGWWYQQVCDVAAARGSVIRQFDNCDLTWQWLQPVEALDPIPPPADLYALMTDEAPAVFWRFNLMVLSCLRYGTRIIPTLFTLDGGSDLNAQQSYFDPAGVLKSTTTVIKRSTNPDARYIDVRYASPNRGVIIPWGAGWDPFYWDPEAEGKYPAIGASPTGESDYVDEHKEDVASHDLWFQQFCLNVMPPTYAAGGRYRAYWQEAARRKALAVAAFGLAIGEHLALWDRVLAGFGMSITDVVPYLELGNEMTADWLEGLPWPEGGYLDTTGLDVPPDPALYPHDEFPWGYNYAFNSALEAGYFMALLAAAAWTRCPKLRFSAPGIASGQPGKELFEDRVQWHRLAIVTGMQRALRDWGDVQAVRAVVDAGFDRGALDDSAADALAWLDTADQADFHLWPPPLDEGLPDIRCLMHHVNFHWFHFANRFEGDERPEFYEGEARLLESIDYLKRTLLSLDIDNHHLSLTFALHPGGFPAVQPTTPVEHVSWSSFASPLFQAGMLVRMLATCRAGGAEIVSWHTHIAGIQPAAGDSSWTLFTAMGVRDDVVGGTDIAEFIASRDALRRPAWLAFRRLASLLQRADSLSLHRLDDDGFVVELVSSAGFTLPPERPDLSLPGARRFKRVFIAWIDQVSDREDAVFTLQGADPSWQRLSLAPAVTDPASVTEGPCGYPSGEGIDWEWTLSSSTGVADWTSVATITSTRGGRVSVHLLRASMDVSPVPLCLCTDMEFLAWRADATTDPVPFSWTAATRTSPKTDTTSIWSR